MAGCVMQICLTSLWSPNHSEVPGSLILYFVTKKPLCAHVCLRCTCQVCFQATKLLAAPFCFGSLLLGVLGFPVAVTLSPPMTAAGMGAFWRSLTPAELNPTNKSIFFSYYAPLEGVIPLARRSLGTLNSGNLCFDGHSSWRFKSKLLFHCSTCSCDWGVIRCALIQILKDFNNLQIIPIEQKLHI